MFWPNEAVLTILFKAISMVLVNGIVFNEEHLRLLLVVFLLVIVWKVTGRWRYLTHFNFKFKIEYFFTFLFYK